MCVAKCGYVSNSGQAEVIQYVLYKPENWLSMADLRFPDAVCVGRDQHALLSLALAVVSVRAFRAVAHARIYGTIDFV